MSAIMRGVVTKAGVMSKTATVTVSRMVPHPKTRKLIVRSSKILTHDEENIMRKGDEVLIRQVAPISKHKAHRLDKILRSPETERDLLVAEQAIAKAEAEAAAAAATTATAA